MPGNKVRLLLTRGLQYRYCTNQEAPVELEHSQPEELRQGGCPQISTRQGMHAQGRSVSWEIFVLNKVIRDVLCSELITVLSDSERIWLSEEIRHQFLMICDHLICEVDVSL